MKNYYKILTVEPSDSSATIKRVFRRLALKLHPDINDAPNANQQFIDLNEAYQVLRNPVKRKRYNKLIDAQIAANSGENTPRRERRKKWESSINTSAKRGKARGGKFAAETAKKFQKRTDSWASRFFVDLVFELTFRTLSVLLASLFEA